MNIIKRMSPNRTVGRQGWQPDMVVCHITEGAFDGTVSWITNPASQVSYHFVVAQDGRIVQAVDIANISTLTHQRKAATRKALRTKALRVFGCETKVLRFYDIFVSAKIFFTSARVSRSRVKSISNALPRLSEISLRKSNRNMLVVS